jgi:hypothetical protein
MIVGFVAVGRTDFIVLDADVTGFVIRRAGARDGVARGVACFITNQV